MGWDKQVHSRGLCRAHGATRKLAPLWAAIGKPTAEAFAMHMVLVAVWWVAIEKSPP
jgi:hypothetical protein